jgi:nucleotide-binding universal stress UspA family protein
MEKKMTKKPTHAPAFTIVVANDFSDASGYAFDQAARVARRIPGSDLHVVHVAEGEASEGSTKQLANQLRLYLEEKVKALGGLEDQAVGLHVRRGRPAREIAQLAKDVGADLIVVGTHKGPHLKQLVLGSVAERLLLAAPCPVFVAGPMPKEVAVEPAIEPACPDCEEARRTSRGREFWCARHAKHHVQAHSYSFRRELPLRAVDGAVSVTGSDV